MRFSPKAPALATGLAMALALALALALTVSVAAVLFLATPVRAQTAVSETPRAEIDPKIDEEGRLMLEEGRRLAAAGRAGDALPFYSQALDMAEVSLGDSPILGLLLHELGGVYRDARDLERAERHYRRALEVLEQHLGPSHPELLAPLADLGSLVAERGEPAESQGLYQRLVSLLRQHRPGASSEIIAALGQLALSLDQQERFEEAESVYRQALEEAAKTSKSAGPELATVLNNLATLYFRQGRPQQAEPLLRRAADLRRRQLGPSHWLVAVSLSDLARVVARLGRQGEALDLATQAAAVLAPYCEGLSAQAPGETRSAAELCRVTEALRTRLKGEGSEDPEGAAEPAPQSVAMRTGETIYRAQLLAREDPDLTQADLRRLRARYSDLLGNVPAHVETIDLGDKGIWHRLQFGNFVRREDAKRLCESLLDRGWEDCWVAEAGVDQEAER